MRVWAICFVLFFAVSELYQWLRDITLPFPVFVVAGGMLAVAANADKLPASLKRSPFSPIPPTPTPTSPASLTPPSPPASISFTIHKPAPVSEETDRGEP